MEIPDCLASGEILNPASSADNDCGTCPVRNQCLLTSLKVVKGYRMREALEHIRDTTDSRGLYQYIEGVLEG